MEADIYRQLQRHIDKSPVPYPETGSGVEIRLLKHLFDEEEAFIALKLSALPDDLDKIHSRFAEGEISRETLESKLNGLAKKGAIMRISIPGKGPRYMKIPLAIGMFEYQVDRVTKEYAEDFFQYLDEGFGDALLKNKTGQLRTIPLNVKIDAGFNVGSYDDARALIKNSSGPFAVMNCICRQSRGLMGEPCRQTDDMRTCFTLGRAAKFMVDRGVGTYLEQEEMLERMTRVEKEGMVLQPANTRDPEFICACCGCCCGVLTTAKKYPAPAEILHTNFYSEVNVEDCTGCGDCIEICPMDALVPLNDHTEVRRSHCIGCGVCVGTCAADAISLVKKEDITVPPLNNNEMYRKMIMERYGLRGALEFMGKAALGKKI